MSPSAEVHRAAQVLYIGEVCQQRAHVDIDQLLV